MSMMETFGQKANGRATLGRTPIYRMMLAGEPLDVDVLDAAINMGEDVHDTVTMKVSSTERTSTKGILESPISFLYGSATKTEVFCGYVTDLTEQQNENGALTWTTGIVGPTKLMQTGTPRFWTQRTIPSAVENLSYLSYLGYTGHDHPHVWPTMAQTDDSDWQMIVRLADRMGWSIFNRYGVVMLHDPLQLFVNNGVAAVLISESYTLAKNSPDEERSLLDFEPVEEAESSTNRRGFKVAYFNNQQMQVALQKGTHSSYRFINDFVIRDAAEADIYVNSHDSDCSDWLQSATARIMGNANLFPGMSVEIQTTNQRYFTGKFNGRWLIRGVQHKMDKQSFQSNLFLARPDGKTQVYGGAYVPFWQSTTRSRPTLSLSNSMTLLPTFRTMGLVPSPDDLGGGIIPDATAAGVWMSSWTNPTVRIVA